MEVVKGMGPRTIIDRIVNENCKELSTQRKLNVGDAITRIIDIWDWRLAFNEAEPVEFEEENDNNGA